MADEQSDTPPVAGETTDAALDKAADAVLARILGKGITPALLERTYWRRVLADVLPHLTAELDAELEQLRAGYASCEYLLPLGHEDAQTCDQPCHPSTDRCPQHDPRHLDYIAGLRSEIASLKGAHEGRDVHDRGRDAETTALREGVQQIAWGLRLAASDFAKEFGNGPSDTRDVLGRVLDLATGLASPAPAVLADPAPSTEHLDVDQLPVDRVEKLAQWLHGRNIGICEMDSNDVYNGLDSMRSLAQQLLQHGPDGIRITAPSTPEGDHTP